MIFIVVIRDDEIATMIINDEDILQTLMVERKHGVLPYFVQEFLSENTKYGIMKIDGTFYAMNRLTGHQYYIVDAENSVEALQKAIDQYNLPDWYSMLNSERNIKICCETKVCKEFLMYRFSSSDENTLRNSRTSLIERLGGDNIGDDLIMVSGIFTKNNMLCYDVDIWIKAFIMC